jgi:hypothetical protein
MTLDEATAHAALGPEIDEGLPDRCISLLREGARRHGLPDHRVQFLDDVGHVE